jgi:TPR repeat protein
MSLCTTITTVTMQQSAAKAGHAEAMATLGGVYEGSGRLSSALQWYQLAAAPGEGGANNARAQVSTVYLLYILLLYACTYSCVLRGAASSSLAEFNSTSSTGSNSNCGSAGNTRRRSSVA